MRILKRFIPVTSELNKEKFVVKLNGVLHATPLLVALVIVEMTDLVFALDSIPAILAITTDSFYRNNLKHLCNSWLDNLVLSFVCRNV